MILKTKKTLVSNTVDINDVTPKKETSSPTKNTSQDTTSTPQRVVGDEYTHHEGDSMRDLFFIVKGQYRKGVEPSFINRATGDVSYVGGHNPDDPNTEEWYMCLDKVTFNCVACGGDLKKVAHAVYTQIMKRGGSAKKYFKYVSDTTSDDYYEVTYLGHEPLTSDKRSKKAEGRCPRTSPPMRCLYNAVYKWYGDYYCDLIAEMEDLAYKDLEVVKKEKRPINKTRKILSKTPIRKVEVEEEKTTPTPEVNNTLKKVVRPHKKLGVKKLAVE